MYTGPLVWPLINPSLTHGCLVLYAHWLQRGGSKKFTAVNPGHTKRSSVTAGYAEVCPTERLTVGAGFLSLQETKFKHGYSVKF